MPHTPRIGIQIDPDDPFWVQVREVMWQHAQELQIDFVEVTIDASLYLAANTQSELLEDLQVQELDALICNTSPASLVFSILERGIPIVCVSELAFQHPLLVARQGLYQAGQVVANEVHRRLGGTGTILIVGGLIDGDDQGESRLDGFYGSLPTSAAYAVEHVSTTWDAQRGRAYLDAFLQQHPDLKVDAIFGLSDPLAIMARDMCRAHGVIDSGCLLFGVNGDPLALAAIANGSMTATVETDVDDIAVHAVDVAIRLARREAVEPHFANKQRLVTVENVAEVSARKLMSLANLPSRLVGVNRRAEEQRVVQLETSLAIDRQVGQILDEHELSQAITLLIRDNYGFDHAQFLLWNRDTRQLAPIGSTAGCATVLDPDGPLAYVLHHNQMVFLPDAMASHRFPPDPCWPNMRARVVVPVRFGGYVVGLLDMHKCTTVHHSREELYGLQLLADQLGISIRNAELYGQAVRARTVAEKADRLKTVLLANVSHEFRTPLNVILGYSRTSLDMLEAQQELVPDELQQDLAQIYHSGRHLLRLINDLLDVSRAEIGELDMLPEAIDMGDFLRDVFGSSVDTFGSNDAVTWRLELAPSLPTLHADPVRLRQIVLNLLHNAHKFTASGVIELGAAGNGNNLHMWVSDTGCGIPEELQSHVFAPFVRADSGKQRSDGIGLGLNIVRRLVDLHNGEVSVQSVPGQGCTFHVYLPLPSATTQSIHHQRPRTLVLISTATATPAPLQQLAQRRNIVVQIIQPGADLAALSNIEPVLLVWDVPRTSTSGWSTVEQIRDQYGLQHVPMMLYTSADHQIEPTAVATNVLPKPLSDDTLLDALAYLDPGQGGTILVVDDDPTTRSLYRRIVNQQFPQFAVREASGGQAALAALAEDVPILLILDLMMPEVDGFAVLEALRTDPRTAMVPVLVLSGRALSGDDIQRLSDARVLVHTKSILSEAELAASLQRTIDQADRLPPHTSAMVKAALAFIQQHHAEPLSRQAIADSVGVNKDYLGRIFQQELGLSPWEYLIRYRVLRARDLLLSSSATISEIATRVGFDTATYFSHIFHREVGCSPRAFRSKGKMPEAVLRT